MNNDYIMTISGYLILLCAPNNMHVSLDTETENAVWFVSNLAIHVAFNNLIWLVVNLKHLKASILTPSNDKIRYEPIFASIKHLHYLEIQMDAFH